MPRMRLTEPFEGDLGEKLRSARLAQKLSTRDVAARLAGRLDVSHATIANYEKKGQAHVSLAVLTLLAEIYRCSVDDLLERTPMLTGVRYRSQKSKIKVADKEVFQAQANRWLNAYLRLEKRLGKKLERQVDPPPRPADTSPAEYAAIVRKVLKLDPVGPVVSVVSSMEKFGIRVIEVDAPEGIDGLAADFGEESVIVLNPQYSNDRMRMNESHELFHSLLGHCGSAPAGGEDEDEAFACGRSFLLPPAQLKVAFEPESFVTLVKYKEAFGISLAAMIYAAERENLISQRQARFLWIEISRRGWRKHEPGQVRPDRATRFEQMLDSAIAKELLTWREAAAASGIPEDELKMRVRSATGEVPVAATPPKGGEPTLNGLRLAK